MSDPLVQVIRLVKDLDTARREMEELGFAVSAGGRHPGRGTANLIVPFGTEYLELLAIVDENEASRSPQGRPVLDALARRGAGLARWSVEARDIQAVAQRLGLPVEQRSRVRPDGLVVRWRSVAVDETWAEPSRCAFMAWDDPSVHPALVVTAHPNGATGFAELVVGADAADVKAWCGGEVPALVRFEDDTTTGPLALTIATTDGPLTIR